MIQYFPLKVLLFQTLVFNIEDLELDNFSILKTSNLKLRNYLGFQFETFQFLNIGICKDVN